MDWQGLSRLLLADHQHEPQTLGRLELALKMAQEALQMMAGHGHQFHLAPGPGPVHPEWPRKLYHVDSAPNGILVYTEKDAEELGPGWFDSFQKAQFWDGLETQFNGRGGVAKSPRVPVPLLLCKIHNDPEEEQRRLDLIAAFKALNRWEKPHALEEQKAGAPNGRGSTQSSVREESRNSSAHGEGIQPGRSGNENSEAEKFAEQIGNFGKQGIECELTPPSLQIGDSPASEPRAVTPGDSAKEARDNA